MAESRLIRNCIIVKATPDWRERYKMRAAVSAHLGEAFNKFYANVSSLVRLIEVIDLPSQWQLAKDDSLPYREGSEIFDKLVVTVTLAVDDASFVSFLKLFGAMIFTVGETPVPGAEDLNIVSNVGRTTPPRSVFHTDTSFVACPPSFTALRPVSLPAAAYMISTLLPPSNRSLPEPRLSNSSEITSPPSPP